MQPIVHGLEEEFGDTVTFTYQDAATADGQEQLRAYGLRGHPSYVIVTADGEVLWSMTGQTTAETLRAQLVRVQ